MQAYNDNVGMSGCRRARTKSQPLTSANPPTPRQDESAVRPATKVDSVDMNRMSFDGCMSKMEALRLWYNE